MGSGIRWGFFARTRLLLCFISHALAGIKSGLWCWQSISCFPKCCRGTDSLFHPPKIPARVPKAFMVEGAESCSSGARGILTFEDRRSSGAGGGLMPGMGERGKNIIEEQTSPSIPSPHRLFRAAEAPCSSPGWFPPHFPAAEPSPSDSGERIN